MAQMHKSLQRLIDFILPPRCIVTGDIVDDQGMITPEAWSALTFIADPQCSVCGLPFEFDVDDGSTRDQTQCMGCLDRPPSYDRARSALVYDDASRNLILPFKHGDKTHFVMGFLPWLKQAGQSLFDETDVIIPVPLHGTRLLQRRYNQSAIIAVYLGKDINKPCLLDGLERVRATPTQGYLKPKEREKNVKRAFGVPPSKAEAIKGKNILLIDDVYTTGATVNECAQTLKAAGVGRVNVLTVARAIKH